MFRRTTRLWLTWIALWAFALAALAPSVSRALAAHDSVRDTWVEVCSVSGERWVHIDEDGAGGTQHDAPQLDHCALCPLLGDRLTPPPVPLVLALQRTSFEPPTAPQLLPLPTRVPLAAAPRGPPVATAFSFSA